MQEATKMTNEQALRELAKIGASFKILDMGIISRMSDSEHKRFMEWLE